MTKFIYDTKSIMASAWEIARKHHKYATKYVNKNYSIRLCLSAALDIAWAEAKEAMTKAVAEEAAKSAAEKAKKSTTRRYVELLSIAVRDGLSHGRSWYLNCDTCSAYGFHPMHEGELVCYVYAD